MAEFGTSSAFRGWVRVRVLGYGFGVRGRKVKSRDCALASDLVRAGGRASRGARAKGSGQSNFGRSRSRFGPSRNRGMSHESKRPWKAVLRASDQATLTRALCA